MATVKENVMLNASNSNLAASKLMMKRKSVDNSSKTMLRGVRVNRRFELQMQHRKLKQ